MQRFFVALHATVPAALLLAVLLHQWAPDWMPSLSQRPVWAVWALIGAWLLMSAAAAWLQRALALWRVGLGGTGVLLVAAGAVGLVQGAALAPAMLGGMVVLGLVCGGLAAFIGPGRVQAHRRKPARHVRTAGTGHAPQPHAARRHGLVTRWLPRAAHLPFWLVGLLAVESFRLAHIVATEPARSSGMLGLLLALLVALPAATLRTWAPRTAALLWAVAAAAFGGLAAKAGLVQWAAAAVLCAAVAATCTGPGLLQRLRRSTAPSPCAPQSPHNPPQEAT